MQPWNPDIIAMLRHLRAQGFSYSAAAKKINAAFATSFTREAMIGKARRLGLLAPGTAAPKPGKLHVCQDEPAAAPRRADADQPGWPSFARSDSMRCKAAPPELAWPRPEQAETDADVRPLRHADITPRQIAFADLEPEHCRYPYGEGPYRFCGHVRRPGSSYCPAHAELAADSEAIMPAESAVDRDTVAERDQPRVQCEDGGISSIAGFSVRLGTGKHVSTDGQGEQWHAARQTQKA